MNRSSRSLKRFTTTGRGGTGIEIAAAMLEQYLVSSGSFRENMRGRFEARLSVLRRGEPRSSANPEEAPGHGAFWLGFSRLCVVLKRMAT